MAGRRGPESGDGRLPGIWGGGVGKDIQTSPVNPITPGVLYGVGEVLVGIRDVVLEENEIGCALVLAPYFLLAKGAPLLAS